jgi:hypothetical protein
VIGQPTQNPTLVWGFVWAFGDVAPIRRRHKAPAFENRQLAEVAKLHAPPPFQLSVRVSENFNAESCHHSRNQ